MNVRLTTAAPILATCFLFLAQALCAQDSVKVGDRAPDFSLPGATKDSIIKAGVRLGDLVGRNNIILAFYPADWSGGCTKEMCTMRDNFASLSDLGADVFGVSGDYVYSHHEWAKYHNLQFTLLSDHNHAVAKAYQSYNPQSGLNRRTVYLVDRTGKVAYIDRAYDPGSDTSFNKLKAELQRIKK
ncbi:peroxiredoxin [bacterium]|nr:MAG: peroxiredoxin [bacterium]